MFLKLNLHPDPQEGLINHRLLVSMARVFDSVGLTQGDRWGEERSHRKVKARIEAAACLLIDFPYPRAKG